MIGLNLLDPDLKNKTDSEDIKFDLKLRNNKIVLNKEVNKENKENKKKCCKWIKIAKYLILNFCFYEKVYLEKLFLIITFKFIDFYKC